MIIPDTICINEWILDRRERIIVLETKTNPVDTQS